MTRCAAEKFRADLLAGAKTYTLRGCNLLLRLFYLKWADFKAVSLHTDLVPKIAVYSSEKMDELIKLVEEDRQRTGDNRQYKTKPEGSMNGMVMRWHPLMVARTELATTPKTVGVQEGMDNIMLVIEETVMPMMMVAVVTVATEMTEANRGSVVEDMCSKVEEQKKKLQICFGSKLYPDAVHMSPNFPAIKYGGNSVSGVGAAEYEHGSSSRGLAAPGGFSWMTLPVKQRQMQVSLMAVLPQTTTKEILPTLATRKLQTQHRQEGSSWFEWQYPHTGSIWIMEIVKKRFTCPMMMLLSACGQCLQKQVDRKLQMDMYGRAQLLVLIGSICARLWGACRVSC